MTMLHSRAGAIPLEGLPITAEQQERLSHTLRCVPADHLRSLQRIVIRDRQVRDERSGEMREYAGGSTNAAQRGWRDLSPHQRRFWIMLDIDSFDPRQRPINNRPGGKHYTLLHELGHLVDWSYGALSWIMRNDPEGFRLLARQPHTGITQGTQERFADAYADLYFHPPERTRDDPRIRCILQSPPFRTAWTPHTEIAV
ncbi:hypothetical protein CDO87_13280 [Sagittula sp. P11]|jgi:hypothetical protein|uniref:hypothetical protein n=1 Tax=unclassified Sagittula TaxID=2624628 RepID=UPI000C2D5317|nr:MULTISPECIES: hypothetical protein [unclassified Sagittula]AUC54086.1 hypothetical protein CDO87_13280 [Sagittula sp. P11]WHZ34546.1 hypothetical protein QNI11_18155 [Sagittula sp. MA-2]